MLQLLSSHVCNSHTETHTSLRLTSACGALPQEEIELNSWPFLTWGKQHRFLLKHEPSIPKLLWIPAASLSVCLFPHCMAQSGDHGHRSHLCQVKVKRPFTQFSTKMPFIHFYLAISAADVTAFKHETTCCPELLKNILEKLTSNTSFQKLQTTQTNPQSGEPALKVCGLFYINRSCFLGRDSVERLLVLFTITIEVTTLQSPKLEKSHIKTILMDKYCSTQVKRKNLFGLWADLLPLMWDVCQIELGWSDHAIF